MLTNIQITSAFLLLGLAYLTGCGGNEGEQAGKNNVNTITADSGTLPNHVKYTFHKRNEKGRKPKDGDLITFRLSVRNHKDAELSNHTYQEQPYQDGESHFTYKPYFKEVFAMSAEGDSLSFWISVDSLMNKPGYLKTPKVQAGTSLKYTLKVLKIRSKEEIKRELKEKYAEIYKRDSASIALFLEEVKKKEARVELQKTTSGLYYYIRKPGKGATPQEGDTVVVNYIEKSIEGSLFGKSDSPTEFIIGQTMPQGLNEGLTLMTEGASSVFILPTELGYGENPSGNIPKNAVLVYEIDMLRLKH
jgi:FKBP-type peptidyl-prolyl cis-trans isomerase